MSASRGQATLELALSALIVVTVLTLGIHLAEVAFASLKVQEAAAYATFEATGARVHRFSEPNVRAGKVHAPFAAVVAAVGPSATSRYEDLSGLSSVNGDRSFGQVLTRAHSLSVQCRRHTEIAFAVSAPGAVAGTLQDLYQDRGGLGCNASATAIPEGLPSSLLEGQGGLFKAPHFAADPLVLCGLGRAVRGECRGTYGLLLGDWGLEGELGASENADARLPCKRKLSNPSGRAGPDGSCAEDAELSDRNAEPRNRTYRLMVKRLYDADRGAELKRSATAYSRVIAGNEPHDESQFHFSFSGEEHGHWDGVFQEAGGRDKNKKGPVEYQARYAPFFRTRCFLGIDGC